MITPQLLYSLLVGSTLVPNLVSIIVRSHWPAWLKGVIAVATSIIAGTITAWANGQLTGLNWVQDVFAVAVAAIGAYKMFWQPTGIGPALELATQPSHPAAETPSETLLVKLAKDNAAQHRGTE